MVAPGAKKLKCVVSKEAQQAQQEALTLIDEAFQDFDVVWAKVQGFPWWPGVLFHSWDVVRRAGIRTDPRIVAELVVPPPEKVPASDKADFRWRRHCLVMFLDKFNFSLLEIDPSNVASFTAHYQAYERAVMGSKRQNKKKSEFKRALVKAAQLLHMGKEYADNDLVLLEEPSPAEKKQRMEEVMEFEQEGDVDVDGEGSLEDAWDDKENADDAMFTIEDDDMSADKKKPTRKSQKKTRKVAEVKEIQDDEDEVVVLTPAKSRRKAPAKDTKSRARKPSRKEAHHVAVVSRSPSPIDLTNTPESEKKKPHAAHKNKAYSKEAGKPPRPRKRKANGDSSRNGSQSTRIHTKALVLEDEDDVVNEQNGDARQISDEVSDITREEEPSNLLLTPLSSIWTTGVSNGQNAGSSVQPQLAYKQAFVWDDAVFTDELSIAEKEKAEAERKQAEDAAAGSGRDRSLGKRQSRSVQQSQIRQNLMTGNLDPHTMVQCAAYRPKDYVEDPNSRSRGGPTLDPPFQVVVHPDAVFVADLHAHLATCEIIGFLGGKWDEASKTLYIQAAFPCRSLVIDGDDGSTDVEMDPGSEIELRGIIENAQLEVVGWYHSHPAFAPDPSVRDIENQTSYQQLFQRPSISKGVDGEQKPLEPFVGLIVGTYDTRRNTPVSLFRYFHTRGEKVSGGARREIYMPYEFIPGRRHFRNVLLDEDRVRTRTFPMYRSILQHFEFELVSVKQHLPTDIITRPASSVSSRSSPSRVKVQGPVRKRRQSPEGVVDIPAKKPRSTRSRRSTRSVASIDLTEDKSLQTLENESAMPMLTGQNGCTKVTAKVEATVSNGVAVKTVRGAQFQASSADDNTRTSRASARRSTWEVIAIEPQVAEVVADVVVTTEIVSDSGKRSRKDQNPNRINENSSGLGGDEHNHPLPDNAVVPRNRRFGGTVERLTTQINVDATGVPTNATIPRPLSTSVKLGMSPSPTNNRKRTRKPKVTTKNSNRSASPVSDGPSPARSPGPDNRPGQTFQSAFHASGPCVPKGNTYEEVTPPPTRSHASKPDNGFVEDTKYIVVGEESMDMVNTSQVGDHIPVGDKVDEASTSRKTLTSEDLINQEVQSFVASLVEKVVEKVASEIVADVNSSAPGSKVTAPHLLASSTESNRFSSDSSMDKTPPNGVVKVEVESKSLKPVTMNGAIAASVQPRSIAKERGARPQLFGSNSACEDIQTSLQKMAGHLDKLKSSQVVKSSEPERQKGIKLTPVVAKPEIKENAVERDYLTSLRTKYGVGVSGCAEQVITLVDYYRDFERRTDLSEIWKSRITKLEKIESSLSEYVQFLNMPAALRQDFIKDLISYLRESWAWL